jgi:hypothetical protein
MNRDSANIEASTRLEHIARDLRERIVQACQQLVTAPAAHPWQPRLAAGMRQIEQAEQQLQTVFPLDLSASYRAVADGAVPLCGWSWWPLEEAVLQTRLQRALAAMRGIAGTDRHTADGVKCTAWHPGWIAVAVSTAPLCRRLLCVDTAPEHDKHWGQLIEVSDPTHEPVDPQRDPPRRLASGWLSYWQRLAVALDTTPRPDAVAEWLVQPAALTLQLEGIHPLPEAEPALPSIRPADRVATPPEPAFELQALLPSRGKRVPKVATRPRELRVTLTRTGEEHIGGVELRAGDTVDAQAWLKSFSASQQSAIALMVGHRGDGLTTLVMQEVERLTAGHLRNVAKPIPFHIDLALHVDHASASAPATLAGAVRMELARRGLPEAAQSVLQAISDGRCTLVLDHVESVAIYQPHVWRWIEQLPPRSAGAGRGAHVLMLCADEYFDDDEGVASAAQALRLSCSGQRDETWCATLEPLSHEAARLWRAEAGLAFEEQPAHLLAWEALGIDNRATAARLAVLRPLFERKHAPSALDVFTAWWRHVLPAELDAHAMRYVATSLELTELQQPHDRGSVPAATYAFLLQQLWPQASPAAQARLRMAIRIGLQLTKAGDGLRVGGTRLWSSLAVVDVLAAPSAQEGDLGLIGIAIAPGWRGTSVANAVVHAWAQAGHTAPPIWLATALAQDHSPKVAGALFRLACQFAREEAATRARAAVQADRTLDFDTCHTAFLAESLALVCPSPMSKARLVGASLRGAALRQLPLTDLDLSRADLTDADFTSARLVRVSLDEATADGACFQRAVLEGVSAERLIARRSDWQHARWDRRWPTADLKDARATTPGVHPGTTTEVMILSASPGQLVAPLRRLLRSPGGRWIAALGEDGSLGVCHGDTLAPAWHLRTQDLPGSGVLDAAFLHDGEHLITSHAHRALRAWACHDGRLLHECTEMPQPIDLLLVHAGGQHIVGYGGQQHLWCGPDLRRLTMMPSTVPAGSTQGVSCAVLRSPRGEGVFARTRHDTLGLWEYRSAAPRRHIDWPIEGAWRMATVHDARAGHDWLAVLDADAVWLGNPDATTPPRRYERPGAVTTTWLRPSQEPPRLVPSGACGEMAFSPDGRWLVCVGPGGPPIAIDTRGGDVHPLGAVLNDGTRCAAFGQEGQLVLGGNGLRTCDLPGP